MNTACQIWGRNITTVKSKRLSRDCKHRPEKVYHNTLWTDPSVYLLSKIQSQHKEGVIILLNRSLVDLNQTKNEAWFEFPCEKSQSMRIISLDWKLLPKTASVWSTYISNTLFFRSGRFGEETPKIGFCEEMLLGCSNCSTSAWTKRSFRSSMS